MALSYCFRFICLHLVSLLSSISSACLGDVFIWMPFCQFKTVFVPKAAMLLDFSIFGFEVIIFPSLKFKFLWPSLTLLLLIFTFTYLLTILSETNPMLGSQNLASSYSIILLKAFLSLSLLLQRNFRNILLMDGAFVHLDF